MGTFLLNSAICAQNEGYRPSLFLTSHECTGEVHGTGTGFPFPSTHTAPSCSYCLPPRHTASSRCLFFLGDRQDRVFVQISCVTTRQWDSAPCGSFSLCLLEGWSRPGEGGQCHPSRTAVPSMLTDAEPNLPPPSVFILKLAFTRKVCALILHRCLSDRG